MIAAVKIGKCKRFRKYMIDESTLQCGVKYLQLTVRNENCFYKIEPELAEICHAVAVPPEINPHIIKTQGTQRFLECVTANSGEKLAAEYEGSACCGLVDRSGRYQKLAAHLLQYSKTLKVSAPLTMYSDFCEQCDNSCGAYPVITDNFSGCDIIIDPQNRKIIANGVTHIITDEAAVAAAGQHTEYETGQELQLISYAASTKCGKKLRHTAISFC